MEPSPGDDSSPSSIDQPSAPSNPPGQPPIAHTKPDLSSGNQPAGPGAAGEALAVLTSFGRRLLVLVPVYLAGAIGLSVGFVLFGLALYLGWRRVRDKKERSLRVARQLLDDEERLTAKTLYMSQRELPAWVSDHPQSSAQHSPLLASVLGPSIPVPKIVSSPHLSTMGPAQTSPSRPTSLLSLGTDLSNPLPRSLPLRTCRSFHRIRASSSSSKAVLILPWLSLLLAKLPFAFDATFAFAAPGHPRFCSCSEGSLVSPVLLKTPLTLFKAIRFFSLSRSYLWGHAGTQPPEHSPAPAPGQTFRPSPPSSLRHPGRSAGRRLLDEGRRCLGGVCVGGGSGWRAGRECDCCSARCPHSTSSGRPHPFPDCGLRLLG